MPAVSLVTLGVRDLTVATDFYVAWGWRLSSSSVPGEVAFLHGTTTALGLYGWDDLADDAQVPAEGSGFRGISLAMNLPDEASVDARFAAGLAAGGRQVKAPVHVEWGGYSGYLADPDGHLWELAHNPGWPLRPDGGVELQP